MKQTRLRGATKARTGCDACKEKHVKCDEAKPVCTRCRQHSRQCVYDPIRIFTAHTQSQSIRNHQSPSHLHPMGSSTSTIEERKAMYVWVTHTGPWIANYGSFEARTFWIATLPRCASCLPALKHIMVAVALLDDCAPRPNFPCVRQQYQRILRRYNAGIALLRGTADITALELTLTAVLSWLLEIMGFNLAVANLHLSAVKRLMAELKADETKFKTCLEQEDIITKDLPSVLEFCEGYSASIIHPQSTKPPLATLQDQDNPFLKALNLRRGPCPASTCEEILSAIRYYFVFVRPQIPYEITIEEAEHFVTYWKIAIVRFRYFATIAQPVVLLCYLAMSLAHTLLSVTDDVTLQPWANISDALSYILSRADEFSTLELPPYDTHLRNSLLSLIATTVLEIPTKQRHRDLSHRLLSACVRQDHLYGLQDSEHSISDK